MANKKVNSFRQGKFVPKNREKYKGKKLPFYRSGWEKTFMNTCDNSSQIVEWMSEEPKVPYLNPLTGTKWNYHPDFVIKIKDARGTRVEMIEVKPKRETFPPERKKGKRKTTLIEETKRWLMNTAKWYAAKSYCEERGWTFKVIYLENNNFKEATHIRHGDLKKIIEEAKGSASQTKLH